MTFTVNQNLPDGWGGFYLSGRISDYWNRSGTEKQYQVSYNNSFGRLSWSASAQRVYTPDSSGHRRDDRISLNFSYPLWFGDNRTANLTSNTSFNNSRFASSQIGINGSLDSENNLNYGVSTTTATAVSMMWRSTVATVRHGPRSTAATARAKAIVRAALAPAGR
ncbi:Fimbriae usher protein StcC [Klebsiella pneumoniae]|uniref:Fimbriae usher protein StcC n=1 Tax=Klebsiella pneumoniae TaxID=573 RepID=A0A377XB01_KLEPN|nr:Fimbriae usher protein StcC [Klebsiella pneumoniae]